MKKYYNLHNSVARGIYTLMACLIFAGSAFSQTYKEYKGKVVDSNSGDPLVYATVTVEENNISTITNNEGEFSLKVPADLTKGKVIVSFLGYKDRSMSLADFKPDKNRIKLDPSVIALASVNITTPKSAKELVKMVLKKKEDNYFSDQTFMTAFYRETIKKRRRNVSLSEAVVNVYKQPYSGNKRDIVTLYKARKSTDYSKLDTVALKLQGGPFNALYADLMKYPEYIFSGGGIDQYEFSFGQATRINYKLIYVVKFKQKSGIEDPLYYGKLYIEAKTLALTSAIYSLNLTNKEKASELFVRRKPKNVKVHPTEANYRVDYREKDGKWYYGYSNVQLAFKVNWRNKLFNSVYKLSSEMAVTDWEKKLTPEKVKARDRLRPSIVIADEASGFSDPEFWGEYNVIEPEKSIESAINKIQRQLKRNGNSSGSSLP